MPLSWNEIKSRAMAFSRQWQDAARERGEAVPFWIAFFEIFGISNRRVASFEHAVKKHGGDQGFIDLFWPGQMLVEHKSRGVPLEPAFDQALGYFPGIVERDLPHTLVLCDFARFRVIDLDSRREISFALEDLHKHVRWFGFIAGYKAQHVAPQDPVNVKAAERMGRLHDALKQSGYSDHALEVLLVRLLFCLFAEDTAIFPAQGFRAFVEERTADDGSDLGPWLAQLFQVLNLPPGQRSRNLDEQLAAFPYVNGKLFAEALPIAAFDAATREALLDACALDWSSISPAIFGSLFQSIMDADARRNLGAHYTSEENILKLIAPLFLDALRAEFQKVRRQRNRLFDFHKKLRGLNFFDPACGCGNFLVISYRELRLLELDVLRAAAQLQGQHGQRSLDVHQLIAVDVDQFHGMEIEEFPAQIAQVALWLMDHQMNLRVGEEFGQYFARIPLTSSANIVHGNALQLDWNAVLPASQCSYVLGNPPFVGKKEQSPEQKAAFQPVMQAIKGSGVLDFVAAWYVKAARYMQSANAPLPGAPSAVPAVPGGLAFAKPLVPGSGGELTFLPPPAAPPRAAFVSTNSITQGEQVGVLWGWLLAQGVKIHFAHRAFAWRNEARGVAAVHCVIIGFGMNDRPGKVIYEYADVKGEPHAVPASNINPYLVAAPDVVLDKRSKPVCAVASIGYGSMANDAGHLILDASERAEVLAREPELERYLTPYMGAREFLNGTERWCLWLKGAQPGELRRSAELRARIEAVRSFRLASGRAATRRLADTPALFGEDRQPKTPYLLLPKVSSENRPYMPMGFIQPNVIANGSALIIPGAGLLELAVLQSTMHMAWMRATGGRLESRYQYSAQIVYNNFPWPFCALDAGHSASDAQIAKARSAMETAAQGVLDARAQFPGNSLADLYDPLTMPPALLKAHQKLDATVDGAYRLAGGPRSYKGEAERVALLFQLYQRITSPLPAKGGAVRRNRVGAE